MTQLLRNFLGFEIWISISRFSLFSNNIFSFNELYPNIDNVIGNTGIALDNNGDLIKIVNHKGVQVDSLVYQGNSPWPDISNIPASTIELNSKGCNSWWNKKCQQTKSYNQAESKTRNMGNQRFLIFRNRHFSKIFSFLVRIVMLLQRRVFVVKTIETRR